MKGYVRLEKEAIVQVLDPFDPRFEEVVVALKNQNYTLVEVDLTEDRINEIIAGGRFDYIDGQVVPRTPTAQELAELANAARQNKIADIEAHDKSEAVNSFTVAGLPMWLDRETRAGLSRAIETDKALGSETTVIWHDGVQPPMRFELPVAMAEGMLLQLEAYAKATYNRTQQHKAAVYNLKTAAEIEAYDYTVGYPPKLEFNF